MEEKKEKGLLEQSKKKYKLSDSEELESQEISIQNKNLENSVNTQYLTDENTNSTEKHVFSAVSKSVVVLNKPIQRNIPDISVHIPDALNWLCPGMFRKNHFSMTTTGKPHVIIKEELFTGVNQYNHVISPSNSQSQFQSKDSFGVLTVGPRPNEEMVKKLLSEGYNTFLCLSSKENGEFSKRFFDYEKLVPNFLFCEIQDMKIPKNSRDFIKIIFDVIACLKSGKKVYIHCFGGHGRTHTAVALILYSLYPRLTSTEIFTLMQYFHDVGRQYCFYSNKGFDYDWTTTIPKDDPLYGKIDLNQVPVPQHGMQRDYVRFINGEKNVSSDPSDLFNYVSKQILGNDFSIIDGSSPCNLHEYVNQRLEKHDLPEEHRDFLTQFSEHFIQNK